MKIVLLNPPYFPMFSRQSRSPAVTKSSTLYYPYYLSYAAGVLENEGFDVYLIDAPAEGLNRDDTIKKISDIKPEIVICETSTPSIENDAFVMESIKKIGVKYIIAVGTHVSATPEETLKEYPFIDVIARGEYEYTVREIVQKIKDQKGSDFFLGITGTTYSKDGKITNNKDREKIQNLDELPFVSSVYKKHFRKHLSVYFYGANLNPVVSIISGRGCPYQCAFCVYPQVMMGHEYRLRSIKNLVDELEYIKKELPEVKEIFIEDDTFTVNKKRAMEICDEIIKRKLKIIWSTNSRASADLELLSKMKKSGCRLLCVGFESGSQELLDKMGKGIKLSDYFDFVNSAKCAGVMVHGCFIYGNEGETKETMKRTLALAKKLNCDSAQFYPIMVYPGTRAYKKYLEMGFITAKRYSEWLTKEGLHNCVVDLPNISKEELVSFCDYSRRKFYLNPKYLLFKFIQVIRHPREFKRNFRAAKTLMRYIFRGMKK